MVLLRFWTTMIEIGKTIVSHELFERKFVCDLAACKGACCVEGESGAPLEEDELDILDDIFEKVKPYLRKEGIAAIEAQGKYVIDDDDEYTTPLVDGKECAYVNFDSKGTAKCGIELAYQNGKNDFQKPISCHLYPVRVTKYQKFDAVNFHEWDICRSACKCGSKLNVLVFKFLKEALVRKYGDNWYVEIEEVNRALST